MPNDELTHEAMLAAIRSVLYAPEPAGDRIQRIQRLVRSYRVPSTTTGAAPRSVWRTALRRLVGRE